MMLSRKISASCGASAGRNGRSASAGFAVALMANRSVRFRLMCLHSPRSRTSLCPLPQGERETECAARSSRNLPGGTILGVVQHDAHSKELVTDAIGFFEIL